MSIIIKNKDWTERIILSSLAAALIITSVSKNYLQGESTELINKNIPTIEIRYSNLVDKLDPKIIIEPIVEDPIEKTEFDIPKSLEKEIKNNVKILSESKKYYDTLGDTFSRITQYDDYIKEASREFGLPENLTIGVMANESQGWNRGISSKGAAGPMQLIKITGLSLDLIINDLVDERFSPKSIFKGAEYLKQRIDSYDGNTILGLIAYNYGPGKTNKLIKNHGKEWDGLKGHLPPETRSYVVRVLSRKKMLDDPGKYNIKISQMPLFSDQINNSKYHTVRKEDTLFSISRLYETSLDKIEYLNPMIRDFSNIVIGQNIRVPKKA